MNGDFSQWRPFDPNENFNGVLHQQGRVLIDPDWNDHTRILEHWQGRAGQDVIGDGVAAVPASSPNGFKIEAAQVVTVAGGARRVELSVHPGHAWADGLLVHIGDPRTRVATYLEPPIQTPAVPSPIANGTRDAVILEVSREAFNGFQFPDRLIEPALGGPDTTERVHTRLAFRLLRLAEGEDCHTIGNKLKDDPATLGKLTVSLQPTVVVGGDCPVVEGGGYTGFEHQLYRIEVASVNAGGPKFKWSQFNGGLVGRGNFVATAGSPDRVQITANFTAIVTSGLTSFYLEALQFDADLGQWVVTYGANATLDHDNELVLGARVFGSALPIPGPPPLPPAPAPPDVFFRLWNALEDVSAFTNTASPQELPNMVGIRLVFDAPGATNYRAGDYWVFPVRAGEIKNPEMLIEAKPPQGIRYHRVPLAELNWTAALSITAPIEIEDCRRRFRPLTRLDTCCTYRVGDGIQSFGDFNASDYPNTGDLSNNPTGMGWGGINNATPSGAIQAAINALPKSGGQVCVLPGVFEENITISDRENITITGCGTRSLIRSRAATAPVILVRGGQNIAIESLAIEAHPNGGGILLEGANYVKDEADVGRLIGVTLSELLVLGGSFAAVRASYVEGLTVRKCRLHQRDETCYEHTLVVRADDVLITENVVEVGIGSGRFQGVPGGAWSPIPYSGPSNSAPGGIHIQGLSERVSITESLIHGGIGHGITLGSLRAFDEHNEPAPLDEDDDKRDRTIDPCERTREVKGIRRLATKIFYDNIGFKPPPLPDGAIEELLIARNEICDMGTCGIGVVEFFDLRAVDAFISVRNLSILGNNIHRNMRRAVMELPDEVRNNAGFGGISLADVENLVVHDNVISENGLTHLEAICGIFLLHGEGVDISRNRILDNGQKNMDSTGNVKAGTRGGIVILYAVAPTRLIRVFTFRSDSLDNARFGLPSPVPAQNGIPAAKIHDNIVIQPHGAALLMNALGPVSVLGNQLTSQGASPGFTASFVPGTVGILNLGLSNENYLQYLAFLIAGSPSYNADAAIARRGGLDDFQPGHALANGLVLFANNQVTMDVFESGRTDSLSSILIITLDDLGFHDNQCVANTLDDSVLSQALLFAVSTRVMDNRFTEGVYNALLSAVTLGLLMNTTAHNQGTHCIISLGARLMRFPNTTLFGGVEMHENPDAPCESLWNLLLRFLGSLAAGDSSGGVTFVPQDRYTVANTVTNPPKS